MAAARGVASTFLRRAGLFSLVLALIAGIFGMHVMNGHHITHGPATAMRAASSTGHLHPAGEGAHGITADAGHAAAVHVSPAEAGCPDGDGSGIQVMTVGCTPSVKTGTLAAPAPGTSVLGSAVVRAGQAGPASPSDHRPDSPSPCELSISRT